MKNGGKKITTSMIITYLNLLGLTSIYLLIEISIPVEQYWFLLSTSGTVVVGMTLFLRFTETSSDKSAHLSQDPFHHEEQER